MPTVVEQMTDDLKKEPLLTHDPDRVVALGAAVQAALCEGHDAVRDLVLTDVCPHTLGVEVAKILLPGQADAGYFSPIIDRNTTLPVSRSERYHTLHPQQDEILLKIYQGESRTVRENHLIGRVRLTGLRHKPGQENPGIVDVRFTYDMNGILEVEVTVLHDGRKIAEVFEQRPGSLNKEEIRETLRRLQPIKTHPRDQMPNRARLERAQRLFEELIGEERRILMSLVDQFEAALASQDPKIITEAGGEMDRFMARWFHD
jgi:molecular chaperone HscC